MLFFSEIFSHTVFLKNAYKHTHGRTDTPTHTNNSTVCKIGRVDNVANSLETEKPFLLSYRSNKK